MAAHATPRAPGDVEPVREPLVDLEVETLAVSAEAASEMASRRPSTNESFAETSPPTALPPRSDSDEATTQSDTDAKEEAPEKAGERLATHLDMLAETVRAIVTRVMQPGEGDLATTATATATTAASTAAMASPAVVPNTSGRSEYSLAVREQCVAKHAAGASYKTIATEMHMPTTTVQTIVKRAKQQGGVVTIAQRAGRPRVTDDAVEQTIREIVTRQPQLSAREVLDHVLLTHDGIAVSFETIRRRVRDCRKQLNGTTTAVISASTSVSASASSPTLTFQQQLRAGLQQQQAQLDEVDDADAIDVDADGYSSNDDTDNQLQATGPFDAAGSDTEAEPSITDAVSSDASKPRAAPAPTGKTRRKRGSEYSPEFRELCVLKHEQDGKSYQAIANELDIPPDSVRAIVRKAKRTGSVVTAPRSGRPRKTTDLIDRVILQSVKNSQRSTAKQIQDDLWSIYQVKVSCETIRRRVRDHTKQRLQVVDSDSTTGLPTNQASHAGAATSSHKPMEAGPFSDASPTTTTPSTEEETNANANVNVNASVGTTSSPPPTTRSLKRKRTEYSIDVREQCVALHGQGLGFRKIGEQLSMPHTTVRAIVEKVLRTGSMLPAPRSGRPRKTDEILDKVILQTVKANAKCSARMIQQELETAFDVKVSCETIRRRVKDYMRQKHLFPEVSAVGVSVSADDDRSSTTTASSSIASNPQATVRRRAPPVPLTAPVDVPSTMLADQLQLQRQQQQEEAEAQEEQRRQQAQEQHESMLLMAEITQPFHNVHHAHDAMVAAANDVRTVPSSLMEMMTAAAAAAAAVSNHQHQHQLQHQHQHPQQQHLTYQSPPPHQHQHPHPHPHPHQLPLMSLPYGFGFAHPHQLNQPHAQAMQAMLDEALATQPLEPSHPHQHPHHLHPLQQQQQPPQPPPPPQQPSPMSEFVL